MSALIKLQAVGLFNLISVLGFLKNFRLACSINGIHEDPVLSLFNFVMIKSVSTELNGRSGSDSRRRKASQSATVISRIIYIYIMYKVVVILLEKNVNDKIIGERNLEIMKTDKIIAKTESKIKRF